MNAVLRPADAGFALPLAWQALTVGWIERILPIEQQVYSHPWTRGNFIDSLSAGHWGWVAVHEGEPVAYWVAMAVLDEVHLLNLAVARERWGQGLGQVAVTHLVEAARQHGAAQIWLEVRESNARAQALYARHGFEPMGLRRGYYPLNGIQREDARLMRRLLQEPSA
jgi:ribosomal-protein-alanine N-acetyltransferase